MLVALPQADKRVRAGLAAAEQALTAADPLAFAAARAQVWTALLAGGYAVAETARASRKGWRT